MFLMRYATRISLCNAFRLASAMCDSVVAPSEYPGPNLQALQWETPEIVNGVRQTVAHVNWVSR